MIELVSKLTVLIFKAVFLLGMNLERVKEAFISAFRRQLIRATILGTVGTAAVTAIINDSERSFNQAVAAPNSSGAAPPEIFLPGGSPTDQVLKELVTQPEKPFVVTDKMQAVLDSMQKSAIPLFQKTAKDFREMIENGTVFFREDGYSSNTISLSLDLWGSWPTQESSGFRIAIFEPVLPQGFIAPIVLPTDEQLAIQLAFYNALFQMAKEEYHRDRGSLQASGRIVFDKLESLAWEQVISQLPGEFVDQLRAKGLIPPQKDKFN